MKAAATHLYEVSWEVCNKVGGINTVLRSKAAQMQAAYKDYLMIGPYVAEEAEFEELDPPAAIRKAMVAVPDVNFHYGKWLIKGEPRVVLIDFSGIVHEKDSLKSHLWETFRIDSLGTPWEYDEPVIFCAAVSRFLDALLEQQHASVVHCHEWMAGATLLFLQRKCGTVFTTHATMLGRAISGSGSKLYEDLSLINPDEAAYRHGVVAKHQTERACAQHAKIFTTVSEITALEAEHLLGRRPDVLVLNGLDISRFPTVEETSVKHVHSRERLRDFISYHFFPYYSFSLEHNLMLFITGRPEFRNKGMDVTIHALQQLNEQLKGSERTVTAFFWVPMAHSSVRMDLLENKNAYSHIKSYLQEHSSEILGKVLKDLLSEERIGCDTLFSDEFTRHIQLDLRRFRRTGNPPLCTHHLQDEANNSIIQLLLQSGLDNRKENPVKVVVIPVYLDGNDGLFNLAYYDAIAGTHMGVFPSYYEPWGYTPLETAAMGVPAVTTDLAGFGRFIQQHVKNPPGIWVLQRQGKDYWDIVKNLASLLHTYTSLDRPGRVRNKIAAKSLAELCDWQKFVEHYITAHNKALEVQ